jgi:YVTN family beta-propeller protein
MPWADTRRSASTFQMISSIPGGTTNPYGVAATPDGAEVWVTESGTNTVSVISTATNQITATVVVGVYPHTSPSPLTGVRPTSPTAARTQAGADRTP